MESKIKNRRNKRRLLLLLIALLFTVVLFTSSTYAWFTANKTVKVSTLTVNVAAQNGIQISTDGTSWKSIIQTTDITGVHDTTYGDSINQVPTTLEPVSTAGVVDSDGLMEMYYGTVGSNANGDYILSSVKSTEQEGTTGKFIAFDLFFKVDAASDIYLTTNSGVKYVGNEDSGIKNASRIAFVVLGRADAGASVETIQGLHGQNGVSKYIWEPNYNTHTASAISHANDTYGLTIHETETNAIPYAGVKAEFASSQNVVVRVSSPLAYTTTWEDYFEEVTPSYKTISGFSEKLQIFSLQAGVTKVRIYMWIEGQDVDCENGASGGTITYDLQITTDANYTNPTTPSTNP